jgi:hypothetical protein
LRSFHSILLFTVLIVFPNIVTIAQQHNFNVSGFITDSVTGEELIGTNILVYQDSIDFNSHPLTGTSANRYGFYAIPSLKKGTYIFIFRHIGYKTVLRELILTGDSTYQTLSVEMLAEDIELEEVVIEGKKIEKKVTSLIDISPELLEKLPSVSGEVDLFKSLELLPGVNKASDLSSGLYVRGGSPDQTLTLLDGIVVYNPAHLGNIASTFNTNALSDVKLIKGAFPAEYGGRLSSVLDIKLRSGTKEKEKGIIGIGSINSFIFFEGPIKNSGTYMVSGRGMYYDFLQKNFLSSSTAPRYNFIDLNTKLSFFVSNTTAISLSALFNRDHAYNPSSVKDTDYDIEWKNNNVSLNWQQVNSKSLFLNSTISYVNYEFSSKIGLNPSSVTSSTYYSKSNLSDLFFRQNAEIRWHQEHTIKTGIDLALHTYDIMYSDIYTEALEKNPYAGSDITSIEAAVYFQSESQLTGNLWANYGGRIYYFNSQQILRFEPRISLAYSFNSDLILKGAFAIAHQFIHLIVRNDITLPTDLWYPSTSGIEPSKSTQYVLGLDSYWNDQEYVISLEGYYKDMTGLYEFVNNPQLNPLGDDIEDQFTKGNGESYGVEIFFNKRKGNLNGWIGYSLSWARRQFSDLNNGKIFHPRYDRRHDISLVLSYELLENLNFSASWSYATGQWYTLPPGQFAFVPIGIGGNAQTQLNYSGFNSAQFPAYHKLDLNGNYSFDWLTTKCEVYLNLYNIYSRNNPFARYVVFEDNQEGESVPVVKEINLFPFIPSVGIIFNL